MHTDIITTYVSAKNRYSAIKVAKQGKKFKKSQVLAVKPTKFKNEYSVKMRVWW